jgi:hypothetical protein
VETFLNEIWAETHWHVQRHCPGDAPARRPPTDEMRAAAERFAEPGYRAVASRA